MGGGKSEMSIISMVADKGRLGRVIITSEIWKYYGNMLTHGWQVIINGNALG